MSSSYRKRPKHTSRSNSSQFPSVWSDWVYDEKLNCDQRYRLKGPEQYEYDYRQTKYDGVEQARPRDSGKFPFDPAANPSYNDSNSYTHLDAPYSAIGVHPNQGSAGSSSSFVNHAQAWPHVTTSDPNTNSEKFDPHYKVQKSSQFRTGRIFKILWSEPKGNGGGVYGNTNSNDSITVRAGKNGDSYEKVRRFVITNPMEGHCICLFYYFEKELLDPGSIAVILYGGQGVNKKGVHADHHTIIYSSEAPKYLPGEEQKLTKWPLLVEPTSPRHKLDPASRLNYAKPYTVEYNVKVWFIGKLNDNSYWQMTADYNLVHPPLPTRLPPNPVQRAMPRDTSNYATGGDDGTQPSFNIPSTTDGPAKFSSQSSYPQQNIPEFQNLTVSQPARGSGSSLHSSSVPIPTILNASSSLSSGGKYPNVEEETSLYEGLNSSQYQSVAPEGSFGLDQDLNPGEVQFGQQAPQEGNFGRDYRSEASIPTPANYKDYPYVRETLAPDYVATQSDYHGTAEEGPMEHHDHEHQPGNINYPPHTQDEYSDLR